MALTFPNLLTSPKFLCKYLRIYPPATVIYYTHSQLAVQPCNVSLRELAFLLFIYVYTTIICTIVMYNLILVLFVFSQESM